MRPITTLSILTLGLLTFGGGAMAQNANCENLAGAAKSDCESMPNRTQDPTQPTDPSIQPSVPDNNSGGSGGMGN